MTTTAIKPATTYAAAYATLASIAERLKGAGTAAALDTLAEDVKAARQAYATCKCRLDAIRAEIDAEVGTGSEAGVIAAS